MQAHTTRIGDFEECFPARFGLREPVPDDMKGATILSIGHYLHYPGDLRLVINYRTPSGKQKQVKLLFSEIGMQIDNTTYSRLTSPDDEAK